MLFNKYSVFFNAFLTSQLDLPAVRQVGEMTTCHSWLKLGLWTVTLASIDESVFATIQVHFNYSVTRKAWYYHPRNEIFI